MIRVNLKRRERLFDESVVLRSLGFHQDEVPVCLGYSNLCWGPASRGEMISDVQTERYKSLWNRAKTVEEKDELDGLMVLLWSSRLLIELGRSAKPLKENIH